MKLGVLGDIHANLEALDAVLASFDRQGVDRVVAVGDLVGYGADPKAVLARIDERGIRSVLGNHDAAVAGTGEDLAYFNVFARSAALWTRSVLSPEELETLRQLPLILEENEFMVVHGSLLEPPEFNYIQTARDALECLTLQTRPICFVGHSHLPAVFLQSNSDPSRLEYAVTDRVSFGGFDRTLVNVGSVGQPRDEDPRAVAAVCDTAARTMVFTRVAYDIDRAAGKILAAGLPRVLAERLRFGV